MRAGEGRVSSSYGAVRPARVCTFTAPGRGPRDLVSFLVPGRGGEEAVAIAERPATKGRAFAVVGPGVEDMLLVGETGDAASEDLTSDARRSGSDCPAHREHPFEDTIDPLDCNEARCTRCRLHWMLWFATGSFAN